MLFELTPRVVFETKRIYGEIDYINILNELKNTDFLCDYKDEVERIRLGILLGSNRNKQLFEDYIRISKKDYRDVLVSSGLGNSDWKEVLIKSGFKSMENKHFNEENKTKYIFE